MRVRGLSLAAAVAAGVLSTGCATNPAPVPAVVDARARILLAGDWSGEYRSPEKDRSGAITFTLEQEDDSTICRGEVLMVPRGAGEPVHPASRDFPPRLGQPMRHPRLLAIEFVRVEGTRVNGRIEPYDDPDTGHQVTTVFDGTISGDVITGRLISFDGVTGQRFEGSWKVTRTQRNVP